MKATELRINNYLAAADGILCKVIRIEEGGYVTKPVLPIQNIPVFQSMDVIKPRLPIPLTEEWLVKFGFKYSNNYGGWYIIFKEIDKSVIIDMDTDKWYIGNVHRNEIGTIKHVHQLQNLYFALTGEELTIKT